MNFIPKFILRYCKDTALVTLSTLRMLNHVHQ